MIDAVLVLDPTPPVEEPFGEVEFLPPSEPFVHDWHDFYVELYLSTPDGPEQGVMWATTELAYREDLITATSIEFGPGFDGPTSGELQHGLVAGLRVETGMPEIGDDRYALMARIGFSSTDADHLPIDIEQRFIGPFDMGFEFRGGEAELFGSPPEPVEPGTVPQTGLWSVPYDMDGNHRLDFGDMAMFAPVLGFGVDEFGPPTAWLADFDGSGVVDVGDFDFFGENFGSAREGDDGGGGGDGRDLLLPAGYPGSYQPTLQAALKRDTAPGNTTNGDGVTSDPTIAGTVDTSGGATVTSLAAQVDSGTSIAVSFDAQGKFTFNPGLALNGTNDGVHSVLFTATDSNQKTATANVAFTLDTVVPAVPTFDLSPESDTAPLGDKTTEESRVNLTGQTTASTQVTLVETGHKTTSDGTGKFAFASVSLVVGSNPLTARAFDAAGNQSVSAITVTRQAAAPPTADTGGFFLKIDGIDGESGDSNHKDWIDVLAFSHGVSQAAAIHSGGARSAARSEHDDFRVIASLSKASPKLALAVNNGQRISEVTLEAYRAGGSHERYMEYVLSDVVVTSYAVEGNTADGRPTEEVALNYGKIEWTYTEIDTGTGLSQGEIQTHWDVFQDQGGLQAEPGAAESGDSVPADASAGTEMFMKIDGLDGESADAKHKDWIEIEAFSHGITHPAGSAGTTSRFSGPSVHDDFHVVSELDKASPQLALYACQGTRITEIKVELVTAGSTPQKYMEYVLKDVLVTSIDVAGTVDDARPTEAYTFSYGKIEWTYTEYDQTGSSRGDVSAYWNVAENMGGLTASDLAALTEIHYARAGLAAEEESTGSTAMFLKIEGLDGESADDKHEQWIEVLSFSHGLSQPAATSSAGGSRSSARCEHDDFRIVKLLDKTSPKLALYASNSLHLTTVTLELVSPGTSPMRYMQYVLKDVIVTSFDVRGTEGEARPTEEISLNYGKIEWTYTEYDGSGTSQGNVSANWNVETNTGGLTAAAAIEPSPASVATIAAAPQPAAVTSTDYFLKIDGIDGESTDAKHKDWIDVLAFSHEISNPASSGSGGGRVTGRSQHGDFRVVTELDKASPKLALYASRGDHITEVKLQLVTPGGTPQQYMEYVLSDVIVSSFTVEGAASSGLPVEVYSLNYGKIEWTYTEFDSTGSSQGDVEAHWNVATNAGALLADPDIGVVMAGSDVLPASVPRPLPAAVSTSDYFLKIEGVPGESTDSKHQQWIEILSYSHSITQPTSSSSGGSSRTTGRSQHADFQIVKSLDKASPKLPLLVCNGNLISQVKLELHTVGSSPVKYMEYVLHDVIVSSVAVDGIPEEGRPIEAVSLNYGKIEWTYTEFDSTGSSQGNVTTHWDLEENAGGLVADATPLVASVDGNIAPAVPAADTFGDYFLKIDGVSGESTDSKHKDWIDALAFSHGISRPVTSPSGGGRSSGPSVHEDFRIVTPLSKASPTLALYVCQGTYIPEVKLQLVDVVGTRPQYMEYVLSGVYVTSLSVGPDLTGDGRPIETYSFNYERIKWTYTQYDPVTGSSMGNVEAEWNRETDFGVLGSDEANAGEKPVARVAGEPSPMVWSAAADAPTTATVYTLTDETLAPLAHEAIARWVEAGADADVLDRVRFEVAPLWPGYLGYTADNLVQIDDDAAGYGWFVDDTPNDNADFPLQSVYPGGITEYRAEPGTPAAEGMDLLTTLVHELGHTLALAHADAALLPGSVMLGSLGRGVRRLPAAEDFDLPRAEDTAPGDVANSGGPAIGTSETPQLVIMPVIVSAASGGDVAAAPPVSLASVAPGETFVLEIWVQDVSAAATGVTGGYLDLSYTTATLDPVGNPQHGGEFVHFTSGTVDDETGLVDDFGGGTLGAGVGAQPQWARLGYLEFLVTDTGPIGFEVHPGGMNFSRFSDGSAPWEDVQGITPQIESAATAVVDHHLFYNNSAFDGFDAVAGPEDDAAIAPDKAALLPGQTATLANYSSYKQGVNGIMIDVDDLPDGVVLNAGDFRLAAGNDNDPSGWQQAPPPSAVTVREDAGTGGSDRVTLTFPDRAIIGRWLEVTMLANAKTGLATDHVFYFGSAVGEAGNSDDDAMVTVTDLLLARNNPRTLVFDPAEIDYRYDYNRDRKVDATDLLLARNNQTDVFSALQLIVPADRGMGGLSTQPDEPTEEAVDLLLTL